MIIENGTNAFAGIVDKLGNITTEFIPYIIYIFIGILGISLIINAVKYILGYLKGESKSTMQERRRRRRQQRRKTYSYDEAKQNPQDYYVSKYTNNPRNARFKKRTKARRGTRKKELENKIDNL